MTSIQKRVLLVAILASFVAFLDGSVVNVALPAISRQLGGGLQTQQWVVDAYLITLGAAILIAGSVSDLFGRMRVLKAGLIAFGATSLLCALAPTASILIVSRGLQGLAGALLVPSSLALIISAFSGAAQGKAIGQWTAWTGIAFLIGPLLGGLMVDAVSWRLVFAINVLPILIVLFLMRPLEASEQAQADAKVDVIGALLCALGLGLPVFGLIEQPHFGWSNPLIVGSLVIGALVFTAFLLFERRARQPMLPLDLFSVRNFSVGNAATLLVYAGLSAMTFLLAVYLQQIAGYKATAAGLALLPITIIMFFLSPRSGALSGKYGPRWFMAAGPIIAGCATLLFLRLGHSAAYLTELFPAIVLFGLGLTTTVSPLTAAILGSVLPKQAGIGSAVNNAVARIAGLVAVAVLGVLSGTVLTVDGFHRGILLTAALLIAGGIVSAIGIQNPGAAAPKKAEA